MGTGILGEASLFQQDQVSRVNPRQQTANSHPLSSNELEEIPRPVQSEDRAGPPGPPEGAR